jgi:hypothetical protein
MKDFIQDLTYRVLKNIALKTELYYNDKDFDISEYDIQAFLSQFFKRNVHNTGYVTYREAFGKFDCVIAKKETDSPAVLYELKTYVKPKEVLNRKSAFKKIKSDFEKLKDGIQKYKSCRGFFILICKKKDFVKKPFTEELEFILNRFEGKKGWKKIEYKKDKIIIKPSRKCTIERVVALCWEIK